MAAYSRRTSLKKAILIELEYWRAVRLDDPARKYEAMMHIDRLLDHLLELKVSQLDRLLSLE
jgi:hypothetical protein